MKGAGVIFLSRSWAKDKEKLNSTLKQLGETPFLLMTHPGNILKK
jgi:hypothetical protein